MRGNVERWSQRLLLNSKWAFPECCFSDFVILNVEEELQPIRWVPAIAQVLVECDYTRTESGKERVVACMPLDFCFHPSSEHGL